LLSFRDRNAGCSKTNKTVSYLFMNLILFALRRPLTIVVMSLALGLGCFLAVGRSVFEQLGWRYPEGLPQGMDVDIFPSLDLPVIYVCQPYGGMDPAQMEGFLTNYYEYHFLYISGIHHVESKNVQGTALMKLFFHPGTDMAQAMAETINYVNRSQAFMPPGTVSPFVMRFDTGSVPVGYLVMSSATRSIADIQDIALFKVRPMFSSLPGVSAPPPFGGSARTVVITVDPQRLRSYGMSPEEVITAVTRGNVISPSGNVVIDDKYPMVPTNTVVKDIAELNSIPIRTGEHPVYLRDVGVPQDSADAPAGFALANGRRAVYILANKRADASTLSVIHNIKQAIPKFKEAMGTDGEGIEVSFEFDQSPYVTRAVRGVIHEGLLGAGLVACMVLVFLRDWRSALIVIINIPLALMASVLALWLTGQTINLMTLGGLALAIGILVDESTVEIENIHAHLRQGKSVAQAVYEAATRTMVPRLLAMLCILAVFVSAFFMKGAPRALFIPLSLAVAFSMVASFILSSTLVPVLSVWWLKKAQRLHTDEEHPWWQQAYQRLLKPWIALRWLLIPGYLLLAAFMVYGFSRQLSENIFPTVDAGQFRLRMRAPDGTQIVKTEQYAKQALEEIQAELGPENIELTLGYVGLIHSNFPVIAVYHWSRGPEEAILYVDLKEGFRVGDSELKERIRQRLTARFPEVRFSFEPSDIINEVMSFGSPTPIEVAVTGSSLADNRLHAEKIRRNLEKLPAIRDLHLGQSMDYPAVQVNVNREKAGMAGLTAVDISKALVTATSSSRFIVPNYWADPKSGIAYQVQVEIPRRVLRSPYETETVQSVEDLGRIPLKDSDQSQVLLRDVAELSSVNVPGQYDRYNMKRQVTLTANLASDDLGAMAKAVSQAIAEAGEPPKGVEVQVRGQIPPMKELRVGLLTGLALSIVAVFLLLTASYQSVRLALVAVSTIPAVLAGVVLTLWLTRTSLNIQSYIGAIMAIGVAMANAILLVTFSMRESQQGVTAASAAASGAAHRLRAVLMTTCAMVAGMLPMALGIGEAGQQNAPLGRAVIGGLLAATLATLWILPCFYAWLVPAKFQSSSLDPTDLESPYFQPTMPRDLTQGAQA
jgi:multidrug efflux pump subunit AcrB